MARVLIVGCGCRGRALAAELVAAGHRVRGTSRRRDSVGAIEAAGYEGALADPLRLATLMPALDGVSVACWLLGSVRHDAADLHGARLRSLLELLVDTHVRGFVYEAAGSVDGRLLASGAELVERARRTHGMPVALVEDDPGDAAAWLAAARRAVEATLG